MTTLPIDDRAVEAALADLTLTAPPHLAADVLVDIGLADHYAAIDSPIGLLYVAWNGRGVSTVGLARDDAAFESEHRERTGRTAVRAAALPAVLAARIARRVAVCFVKIPNNRVMTAPGTAASVVPFGRMPWRTSAPRPMSIGGDSSRGSRSR